MKKFIYVLSILLISAFSLFLSSCDKDQTLIKETEVVNKVTTPLSNNLNPAQIEFQKIVDQLYTYRGDVTKNFDKKDSYVLPNVFANEGIKNLWKRMVAERARNSDYRWDPYPHTASILWGSGKQFGDLFVVPVSIDLKPMVLDKLDENRKPIGQNTYYKEKSDEFSYFTIKLNSSGIYNILNINGETMGTAKLEDFSKEYTEKDWNDFMVLIQEQIKIDPALKYHEEYIKGNLSPDEFHNYIYSSPKDVGSGNQDLELRGTYNRGNATSYAYSYANSYNSSYKSFGNDCANFVSQCIRNGGFVLDYTPNNTTSCNAWWYSTNGAGTGDDTNSQTWSTANGLRNYLQSCQSYANIVSGSSGYYSTGVEYGDVMFIDFGSGFDGVIDHTLIIYQIAAYIPPGGSICYYIPTVCAHTENRRDYGLWNFGYTYLITTHHSHFGHITSTNWYYFL
jgi:hypothetical protein